MRKWVIVACALVLVATPNLDARAADINDAYVTEKLFNYRAGDIAYSIPESWRIESQIINSAPNGSYAYYYGYGMMLMISGQNSEILSGMKGDSELYEEISSDICDIGGATGFRYTANVPYEGESRLLEGDSVTLYGICQGTTTATTLLGQQVTMPSIEVEYIN